MKGEASGQSRTRSEPWGLVLAVLLASGMAAALGMGGWPNLGLLVPAAILGGGGLVGGVLAARAWLSLPVALTAQLPIELVAFVLMVGLSPDWDPAVLQVVAVIAAVWTTSMTIGYMAYRPRVRGLAAARPQQVDQELWAATRGGTSEALERVYRWGPTGEQALVRETETLRALGYDLAGVDREEPAGPVIAVLAFAFALISLFLPSGTGSGGSTRGSITAKFVRRAAGVSAGRTA